METVKKAVRAVLKDHTQIEVAAGLYEFYGDKGSFDTYHNHIRKCFSADLREVFKFCDVVYMMKLFNFYEPLYALCDLLGFDKPVKKAAIKDSEALNKAKQRMKELDAEREELKRLTEVLAGIEMPVTITKHSRFSARI